MAKLISSQKQPHHSLLFQILQTKIDYLDSYLLTILPLIIIDQSESNIILFVIGLSEYIL